MTFYVKSTDFHIYKKNNTCCSMVQRQFSKLHQGLLYTRTYFLPKEISKIRPSTRFNTNKSGVAQIPFVTYEILNHAIPIKNLDNN